MSTEDPIIGLHPWLNLPSGKAALENEQIEIDRLVSNVFGFHALQLGLPEVQGLRSNRIRYRWLGLDHSCNDWAHQHHIDDGHLSDICQQPTADLWCDFDCLPFANSSLDLVVLPHSLELSNHPHHTLSEVARVLVPEGRVVISAFNPVSFWGLSQRMAHWGVKSSGVLPQGELIGWRRLKDWLHLLGMEVEEITFSTYRPLLKDASWWGRLEWMERLGQRWWPQWGAVYHVVAVKRLRGLRLVGKIKQPRYQHQPARAGMSRKPTQSTVKKIPHDH